MAQDSGLSRRQQGFESPRERHSCLHISRGYVKILAAHRHGAQGRLSKAKLTLRPYTVSVVARQTQSRRARGANSRHPLIHYAWRNILSPILRSFQCRRTQTLFEGHGPKWLRAIRAVAERKLTMPDNAGTVERKPGHSERETAGTR